MSTTALHTMAGSTEKIFNYCTLGVKQQTTNSPEASARESGDIVAGFALRLHLYGYVKQDHIARAGVCACVRGGGGGGTKANVGDVSNKGGQERGGVGRTHDDASHATIVN